MPSADKYKQIWASLAHFLRVLFHLCPEYFINPLFFTITAEILARSLANCYFQYADRHINLKFV